MKQLFVTISFLVLYSYSYSQLPETFLLEMNCEGLEDELYFNGTYIKSETLSSILLSGFVECGCWDRVGTDDFLTIFDTGTDYQMVHYVDPEGEGCAGVTELGPALVSLSNPSRDCVLENYTELTIYAEAVLCSTSFRLTDDLSPIPTLSQWGIIALSLIMLVFGVVAVRQRKVIFG